MVGLHTPAARFGAASVLLSAPGAGAQPMLLIDGKGVGIGQLRAEGLAEHGWCHHGQTDAT
jgi:hypothetical protein